MGNNQTVIPSRLVIYISIWIAALELAFNTGIHITARSALGSILFINMLLHLSCTRCPTFLDWDKIPGFRQVFVANFQILFIIFKVTSKFSRNLN